MKALFIETIQLIHPRRNLRVNYQNFSILDEYIKVLNLNGCQQPKRETAR